MTTVDFSHFFRSERLVYRALAGADDDAFLMRLLGDAETYGNLSAGVARPFTQGMIEEKRKRFASLFLFVIICLPSSGVGAASGATRLQDDAEEGAEKAQTPPTPIGMLMLVEDDKNEPQHRNTRLGLAFEGPYRGRGYGSESIEWALEWAFETAGLHRIEIGGYSFNMRAMALYERMGFIPEGREREKLWYRGRWRDMLRFSMLEGEWRERREKRRALLRDGA